MVVYELDPIMQSPTTPTACLPSKVAQVVQCGQQLLIAAVQAANTQPTGCKILGKAKNDVYKIGCKAGVCVFLGVKRVCGG